MSFWTFLSEFARAPKQIGSVAPSGKQLSRHMVEAAAIRDGDVVVEIGAGTGPITRALRAAHPDVPLLLLEPSARLAATLRAEFPDVEVVEELAQDLPAVLRAWGHERADRVVSGLPWTMWSDDVIAAGLDAVVAVLPPDGRFVTFSYLHSQALLPGAKRFRRLIEERFATVETTKPAWLNLPPAMVFVCSEPRG